MARPRRVKHKKPGPVTEVCWHDLLEYVQRQLPAEELEVFDLHYIQDLSEEFVARILNVSVSTVKRRWRSTRLRLAKQSGLKNLLNGS
jgi:DNA-directed RNA polymerase specialized sigma24 family protein